MDSRRISALGASALLVSLGLGITHLVTLERLSFAGGIAIVFAAAASIPALRALHELARDSTRDFLRAGHSHHDSHQPPAAVAWHSPPRLRLVPLAPPAVFRARRSG